MASEMHKEQRSKRIFNGETKAKRQAAIAKAHGMNVESPHLFDKRHAMTCGDSNCAMCGNPRKFFGERTVQERRNEQRQHDIETADDLT